MVAHVGHSCAWPCAVAHTRAYGLPHDMHARGAAAMEVSVADSGAFTSRGYFAANT